MRIIAGSDPISQSLVASAALDFARFGVETVFSSIENSEISLHEATDAALLRGDAEVAILPLSYIPTEKVDGIVVAALSERLPASDVLLFRRDLVRQHSDVFGFPEKSSLGVFHAIHQCQLEQYRADFQYIVFEFSQIEAAFSMLKNGELEGLIFPKAFLDQFLQGETSTFDFLELHPQEFVPVAGQGVAAWKINAQDHALRNLLLKMHHPDVASITNVERGFLRLVQAQHPSRPIAAHCTRDKNGWYHLIAAVKMPDGSLLVDQHSTSTKADLATTLAEKMGFVEKKMEF